MNVSAVIVTRGDVDLREILRSIPFDDVVVWNNGDGSVSKRVMTHSLARIVTGRGELPDLAVYGRYAAIEYADHDLIYVQDDDVLHTPEDIEKIARYLVDETEIAGECVVCNMPAAFRARSFYDEHSLVGFGACFHRNAPEEAFSTFWTAVTMGNIGPQGTDFFNRTCDIPFTFFNPRVLVDIDYQDMPWASADNRMWKQPTHQAERSRMLEFCKEVIQCP